MLFNWLTRFGNFPMDAAGDGTGGGGSGTPPAKVDPPKVDPPAGGAGDGEKVDLSKLDPAVQKMIKDLRTESAENRNKNKSLTEKFSGLKKGLVEAGLIEDDEADPVEKIKQVSGHNAILSTRNAVLEAAIQNGIGADGMEYFGFLVEKKLSELGDDEELGETQIAEIAVQVKKFSTKTPASTSADAGAGNGQGTGAPPPGGAGSVTLDQFVKMNMMEKTGLYTKNPDLYKQLMGEAKSKRLIV